jgi:hypothetical protein
MSWSEKRLEAYLVKEVKKMGGLCLKFTSPGCRGVPDRICVFPGSRCVFVELKSETGTLRKLQEVIHDRLRKRSIDVFVACNKEDVDWLLHP